MRIIKALFLVTILSLTACKKESGSEFIGTWDKIGRSDKLQIERNGDSFILTTITQVALSKEDIKTLKKSMAATYKDGGLQVSSVFGPATLVIDEKTGHLVGAGAEYQKEK